MIADESLQVNITPRVSLSVTQSAHQSQNASTHVASRSGYTIVAPSPGYQTMQGYSHLSHEFTIPSASSSQCNNLNTTSESVGLSNICLGSNGLKPNTPTSLHSNA